MTEAEWLATADPDIIHRPLPPLDYQQMLKYVADRYVALRKRRLGDRKLRLFACECCRQHWELLSHEGQAAVIQAEEFAEGRLSRRELAAVRRAANAAGLGVNGYHRDYPARVVMEPVALSAAYHTANARLNLDHQRPLFPHESWGYHFELAALIRDIFGNPFRPVAFDPRWRTETAVALATGVYADRAFDRLPVLADALEEAGCDHPDVLAHCRGPGPHVRGCWVVDLVLGNG